jgi:hypothetical protein
VRGQPVKIAKKNAVGNDELQILHVAVGLRRGWVVIEHQQYAGDEKHDEKNEGGRAQIVRSSDAEGLLADFDRQPVEEKVAEDCEAASAVRIRRATAKNGLPNFRLAKVLQRGKKRGRHRLP